MAEEAGAGRLGVEVVSCGPARRGVTKQVLVTSMSLDSDRIWGHAMACGRPAETY